MVLNEAAHGSPAPGADSRAVEEAVAALRVGDAVGAERMLRGHLLLAPNDALALAKLAEIASIQGKASEAIAHLRRALQAAPANDEWRLPLARLLDQRGQPHQALEQLRLMRGEARAPFAVQTLEAALLGKLGQHEPEIAIYEKLVRQYDNNAALWQSYGTALKYAARAEDAVHALRKAVRLRPSYGEGWWGLANLKTVEFSGRDISVMRKELIARPAPSDALHLNFALGKAFEDRRRFEQSFRYYEAGNALRAAQLTRASMYVTGQVDELIRVFDAKLMERVGSVGHPSAEPIFVVGLQRSGSTLVEQILASHPLVEGTSELLAMQQVWRETVVPVEAAGRSARDHFLSLPPETFASMGADYLERTRPFRQEGKPKFIDKLPANWRYVGFIRLVFPNAKIIDARRHPMACGFSNFKQHYASGVAFAYSQDSIGRFYQDYLRLMRHIGGLQPDAIHLVVNEDLIEHTESEVRRLLEFIGVPFDEACLAFHRNRRSVNTPSAEQVRRPINREGVNYWKHYEPWLGPLQEALGPALHDWR